MRLSKSVGDWSAIITDIVESGGFMNGEVFWFTEVATEYDPRVPGSGEPTEVEIATTPARIQHIREPRDVNGTYQWTDYRRFRCQIPSQYLDEPIHNGVKGRITNGGKDPNLVGLVLIVMDARGSSWAPLRTVECVVESGEPSNA